MAGAVHFHGTFNRSLKLPCGPGNAFFFTTNEQQRGAFPAQMPCQCQPQIQLGSGFGQEHHHGIKATALPFRATVTETGLPPGLFSQLAVNPGMLAHGQTGPRALRKQRRVRHSQQRDPAFQQLAVAQQYIVSIG